MKKRSGIYVLSLILIVLLASTLLIEFGFFSIDEESYTYLTKSIIDRKQFHFETNFSETHSELHRAHFSVVSGDNVYSAFPPGYPFLAAPFYLVFGLKGMQIANVVFTVLLAIMFYFFVKRFYSDSDAFVASVILLFGTQILNYSVSLWSHIPAALFILVSLYLLFEDRYLLAGLTLGMSIVVRYSGVVVVPVLLAYLYRKNRKMIAGFLLALSIGISALLFYNLVSFGSPITSGMTLLNAEEGSSVFSLVRLPKGLITNLLHYTFFPELEYYSDKGSLLETSPFFAFSILGGYLFWREKRKKRAEFYTISTSVIVFILFISGTWSLGGLAHNIRLATDIVPFVAFLSVLPLFHLKPDYGKPLVASSILIGLLYFYSVPIKWILFYNLFLSIISLVAISLVLILKKDYNSKPWQNILSTLLIITIGMSIFTATSITGTESLNRKKVGEAAQNFEDNIPDDAVVFIFGGEYPTYTTKGHIFLDYRYSTEDIPLLMAFYENRSAFVLFKHDAEKKKFSQFQLTPAGPPRTYKVNN